MPFNSALSGLQAANNLLRVIGNNIANASSPGFKRSRADFGDVIASGSLGSSSNIIGTGIKLTRVSQQFTQGVIGSTDNNTDLAIDGNGFFVFDKDGSRTYGRNGALGIDKDGNIANAQRQKLVGYLSDANGNITGATGILKVQNTVLAPNATTNVDIKLNLNSAAKPPEMDFVPGFTPTNPPSSKTYNNSTSTQVYDSLGNAHLLTTYFVKAPMENAWRVYLGLDGTDVTPTPAAIPMGGTATSPANYGATDLAQPYTLVFDTNGKYVVNNTATVAKHHGNPPVNSIDTTTALVNSGSLPKLGNADLKINGVTVQMGTTSVDTLSTTDNFSSSIAIVDAINKKNSEHKVTAAIMDTVLDFTAGTFTTNALAAGDFTINGVQITGTPATADAAGLVGLINGLAVPGVVASNNGGQLRLTATDGRNIRVQTDGSTASGITFGNFDLNNGSALDQVKRGQYSLSITNNRAIKVEGVNPANVGLNPGVLAGIAQTSSDSISVTTNPSGGATTPQVIGVDFSAATNFASEFSIFSLVQDGYATGKLAGIEVDQLGVITASYANGQSQQLGQVVLAKFGDPQELQPLGDNTWGETFASGVALLGVPGSSNLGLIKSAALEDSNVQLTEELVALIKAQRNFQASAQTIKTADAVQNTIINIR